MDRRDLEPGAGLHEDQSGLQALLCRDIRGALAGHRGSSLRTGVRPTARAGDLAHVRVLNVIRITPSDVDEYLRRDRSTSAGG